MTVGQALATRLGAELLLVHACDDAVATDGDVDETVERIHGRDAASAIVDYLDREAAALAVTGTHGRSGWGRVVAGSVALGVVRHARCPVVLVPATAIDDRVSAVDH
jgi:nucleotide-binding universal stress UspA family protein